MISEPASVDINVEYTLISLPSDTVSSHVQATSMGYGLGYIGLVILPLSLPVILPPHTDERRNISIQFKLFIIKPINWFEKHFKRMPTTHLRHRNTVVRLKKSLTAIFNYLIKAEWPAFFLLQNLAIMMILHAT